MIVVARRSFGRVAVESAHARSAVSRRAAATSSPVNAAFPPQPVDLLEIYRAEVDKGALQWNDEQVRVVVALRHVFRRLSTYTPSPLLLKTVQPTPIAAIPSRSLLGSFWPTLQRRKTSAELEGNEIVRFMSIEDEIRGLPAPMGVLLIGPPGTGKTRLIQLLYDALPVERKLKRHYHSFLLQIYRLMHEEGQRTAQGPYSSAPTSRTDRTYDGWRREDELAFKVAKRLISEEGWLIFFDELQLTDIATATLVQGVLLHFWRLGGVLLSTSNRLPSDLYGGGVQKKRIESFISCLKGRCDMLELDGGVDWRRRDGRPGLAEGGSWTVHDEGGAGREAWTAGWERAVDGRPIVPHSLVIYNRPLAIARQTGTAADPPSTRVAHFTFSELCENALGTADFLSICSSYGTIFISDVPALTLTKKNEARRLINLIDAMYEHRIHLHVLSAVPVDGLFFPDAADKNGRTLSESLEEEALSEMLKEVDEPTRPNVSVYELQPESQQTVVRPAVRVTRDFRNLSIYSGEDERFAFKRALSRLQEMTNPALARAEHEPLSAAMRTWETPSTRPVGQAVAPRDRPVADPASVDDFASEASYDTPTTRSGGPRSHATRIRSEAHFWGLTEPKAKRDP